MKTIKVDLWGFLLEIEVEDEYYKKTPENPGFYKCQIPPPLEKEKTPKKPILVNS